MKITAETLPANTRFLYKGFLSNGPSEDFLLEWSPSKRYAHFKRRGWMCVSEISNFELLEILPWQQEPTDVEMCPNCVTPWKCNGPHLSKERIHD